MKKLKPIIYLMSVLLSFSACKKEEIHEIDPEFKSYFGSYKDGSWWLLED